VRFDAALTFLRDSVISEDLQEFLTALQLTVPMSSTHYRMRSITLGGAAVPDVIMRLSRRVSSSGTGVDAIFGMDFLTQFQQIILDPSTLRLTLIDP